MKKRFFLLILPVIIIIVIVILVLNGKERIDVTDTDFDYDVAICDKYFHLVECIIDKDTNENYNKQMRIDLKNEVKKMQEDWKHLSEEELISRCTEELARYEEWEDNLNSFGCSMK